MENSEKHKMLSEIIEQKSLIKDLPGKIDKQIFNVIDKIKNADVIYLTGSGTSFHACLMLQMLLNKLKLKSIAIQASEFNQWFGSERYANSILIIFSQSGESIDAINAMNYGKSLNFFTIGVTNENNSKLYNESNYGICTCAGSEKALAATKSHMAQLILDLEIYSKLSNEKIDYNSVNFDYILNNTDKIKNLPLRKYIIFLGSGYLYPVALEASLKMKETSVTISESYPVREFLHGPMQILDPDFTIIFLGKYENEKDKLKNFGANIIEISNNGKYIDIHNDNELISIFEYLMVIQLTAYFHAINKNLDPDHPDKLSKVVK
jgi:glucosamine--fructose-6-phosphate aminotransferase (isomerizing)